MSARRARALAPRLLAPLLLLPLVLAACEGEPASEIVLVVDTDSDVDVLDTLRIEVSGPSGAQQDVTVPYEGAPRTLGLVAATNVLGPVDITVTGSLSTAPSTTVTRRVNTRFEKGVSRVLHIRLAADCIGRMCVGVDTCNSLGACVSPVVDPTTLPAYLGTVSVPELCNGVDDDADGRADEDYELDTDPRHCGSCNSPCAAGQLCAGGSCDNSPIVQVAAGTAHTCVLRSAGGIACWGENKYGELGDGTYTTRTRPVTVLGIADAESIGAGYGFTCAVRRDHSVMCWGSNSCGEIGQPLLESRTTPTQVPGVAGAVEMSGGNCHSCTRLSSGSVYCWGENTYGQIGNGAMLSSPPAGPTLVMNMADARMVRVGLDHSCALRSDGSVSCWGANATRQLGDGTEASRAVPTTVIGLDDLMDPMMRATAIAAGRDFSCALTSAGARCWGANESGQIGLAIGMSWAGMVPTVVPGTAGATAIAVGAKSCFGCVLGTGGIVSCWGCNNESQLGDESVLASPAAVQPIGLPTASAVTLGESHACALTLLGQVWCWGGNAYGQLGIGSGLPSSPPTQVMDL